MAINKNSTGYTFIFSIVMVVVVGTSLAFTALSLKDRQDANAADKKMMNILGAIGVDATRESANGLFADYVVERSIIDVHGTLIRSRKDEVNSNDKSDPFAVDVRKDYRAKVKSAAKKFEKDPEGLTKALEEAALQFPLYRCEKTKGEDLFVIPLVGSGLWGPIWGYVALASDGKTILGAKFDHKTETPGLGAEIKEGFFSDRFEGKSLSDDAVVLFRVLKGGSETNVHAVDGITGGTITSKGVEEMMNRTLVVYRKYFENRK
jgi:Na+-transporting NADH:ubiquinone oxidoreductase subunit C